MNSLKRTQPWSARKGLIDDEQAVYKAIQERKDMGILKFQLKIEMKPMKEAVFNNSVKSLLAKQKIKEVKSVHNKQIILMASEFAPSEELTGGEWYINGQLDTEFIQGLMNYSLRVIRRLKVATCKVIYEKVTNSGAFNVKISVAQVQEILKALVLDSEIVEVKSSGCGEFASVPVGNLCYRIVRKVQQSDALVSASAMVLIPCGACPQIHHCTPDGAISPLTCKYYNEWLNF